MSDESGLTLVEVLVSITLFFIVMGAVVGFYTLSMKATTTSNEKTVAVRIAQQAYERTKFDVIRFEGIGTYNYDKCIESSVKNVECKNIYQAFVNGRTFFIEYEILEAEEKVGLSPIIVKVEDAENKKITSISGFIDIEAHKGTDEK